MSSKIQKSSTKSKKFKERTKNESWNRIFTEEHKVNNEDEFDEMKYCVICAEKIVLAAKSPCHHTTCHKCTFRQRSLYQKKSCLICRTDNERLIFTEELIKEYHDFNYQKLPSNDSKTCIGFTSKYAYENTMNLLKFKCPNCDKESFNLKQYNLHLNSEHQKQVCMICTLNKKAFPSEFKIFTQKQLQTHQIKGDDNGFTGHPLCDFCTGKRFYSDDELTVHLRKNHEKCHVCDQLGPSNPQFFKNYDALEAHFRVDHYTCNTQVCLDKKFVVFADELDLQAHMILEHGNLGNNYIVSTSTNNNRFHSQLSNFRPVKKITKLDDNDSIETKRMRLEERARHYLNYSTLEFKKFLELNNNYKNNHLSGLELKIAYKELFKCANEDDIHLLLYDLSELFIKTSNEHLELKKIIKSHEKKNKVEADFPALPGSSSLVIGNYGGTWNNDNISKTNKQQKKALEEEFPALPVSGTSTYTPVKTTVRYKTLNEQKGKSSITVKVSKQPSNYTFNYLNKDSGSTSSPKTISKPKSKPFEKLNEELFPSLPQVTPKRTIQRVNPIPIGNGDWDTGAHIRQSSASNTSLNLDSLDHALPEISTSGGKKSKKKKQILFQIGGR